MRVDMREARPRDREADRSFSPEVRDRLRVLLAERKDRRRRRHDRIATAAFVILGAAFVIWMVTR